MRLTPVLVEELIQPFLVHGCLWWFHKVAYRVGEEVISCCVYSPVIK